MANMFGALNRFMARLDADPNNNMASISSAQQGGDQHQQSQRPSSSSSSSAYGFQILRNDNPDLPLEPWFDYLIGINGRTIDNPTPQLLATELQNCGGTTISLGIYTAKGGSIREIYVPIPSSNTAEQSGQLGLSLQWTALSTADDVWHILDVMANSPADVAGLLPYGDWVIGSPERGVLRGEAALGELVEAFMDRPLRLWVYNSEYDVVRMVTLTPARNWGGEGALGCVLGYGALHRIPAPLNEPSQAPGETLFEAGDEKAGFLDGSNTMLPPTEGGAPAPNFLVPANMESAVASPPPGAGQVTGGAAAPPPPLGGGKVRKQRAHAPAPGLDDYFAEGEQKSRELDHGSSSKPSASLPPPPKGGPPRATSPADPSAEKDEEKADEEAKEEEEA